jgi:hypothetical protein
MGQAAEDGAQGESEAEGEEDGQAEDEDGVGFARVAAVTSAFATQGAVEGRE